MANHDEETANQVTAQAASTSSPSAQESVNSKDGSISARTHRDTRSADSECPVAAETIYLVWSWLNAWHVAQSVIKFSDGFAGIGSISGAGVLATGWEFPDAVMADGAPYISANSGLPSIKVGGVVELYPLP